MTILGILMIVFFITFCFFLMRTWQVNSFRRFLKKGDCCTFYIGESRMMGVITEFLEGIVTVSYFIGNDEKSMRLPLFDIYP